MDGYSLRDGQSLGLVDEIGYRADALDALKELAGGGPLNVVRYQQQPALLSGLLGVEQRIDPVGTAWTVCWVVLVRSICTAAHPPRSVVVREVIRVTRFTEVRIGCQVGEQAPTNYWNEFQTFELSERVLETVKQKTLRKWRDAAPPGQLLYRFWA